MATEINDPTTYNSFAKFSFYYANGLGISNDATTPNTLLDIATGSILDSTETYQIFTETPLVINAALNGLNGLDTGTFAEATVYAVYLVADPVDLQPTGAMISTSLTGPLMPFGYSAYALIGYATTAAAAAHFLPGYWSAGNTTVRTFTFDAPLATAVTAGTATTYTNVNLTAMVPNVPNLPVQLYTSYLPAAAGNILSLQAGNAVGAQAVVTGQVAAVHTTQIDTILAQPVVISTVSSPVINYKVGSGSDAVAIDVAGYNFFL